MAVTKRIVCLANSRKTGGRCLAGIEKLDNRLGGWIRPVGDRTNQEVLEHEFQYKDGSEPKLLDVIDVPLLEHRPERHQQENWLLDSSQNWKQIDVYEWNDLHKVAETSGTLWQNLSSTNNRFNDRVPASQAIKGINSLKLIHVDSLQLRVYGPGTYYSNQEPRVRGIFQFAENEYALWVTDPYIEQMYDAMGDGYYSLGECYLTISLAESWRGYCYKLIAAVMEK